MLGPGFACTGTCIEQLVPERRVDLTVVPDSGSAFRGWKGACEGLAPCRLTPFGQMQLTALFEPDGVTETVAVATLTVSRVGHGRVAGADGRIACGGVCATRLPDGATATLVAEPAPGYRFKGWAKGCTGTAAACKVVVSGPTEVEAGFEVVGR